MADLNSALASNVDIDKVHKNNERVESLTAVVREMVNGIVDLVEAVEMLPELYGLIPIRRLLPYGGGILNGGKSVKPGVSDLSLHCHDKRGKHRGKNAPAYDT